jgi:hypothetical protein
MSSAEGLLIRRALRIPQGKLGSSRARNNGAKDASAVPRVLDSPLKRARPPWGWDEQLLPLFGQYHFLLRGDNQDENPAAHFPTRFPRKLVGPSKASWASALRASRRRDLVRQGTDRALAAAVALGRFHLA